MAQSPDVPQQAILPERVLELDRRIASAVEDLVRTLHQDVERRLQAVGDQLHQTLAGARPELPAVPTGFLSEQDLLDLIPPPRIVEIASPPQIVQQIVQVATPPPPSAVLFEPLFSALVRIDSESGQANLLTALLEESLRFASRAAFFLIRGSEVRAWSNQGFGDRLGALDPVALAGPWSRLLTNQGATVLSADDCARMAAQLEVEPALSGVLVPFVIRGQLAGALFADRLEADRELEISGLQILAYATAQALETSQVRKGVSTSLLLAAGETLPVFVAPWPAVAEPSFAEPPAADPSFAESPAVDSPAESPAAEALVEETAGDESQAEPTAEVSAQTTEIPSWGTGAIAASLIAGAVASEWGTSIAEPAVEEASAFEAPSSDEAPVQEMEEAPSAAAEDFVTETPEEMPAISEPEFPAPAYDEMAAFESAPIEEVEAARPEITSAFPAEADVEMTSPVEAVEEVAAVESSFELETSYAGAFDDPAPDAAFDEAQNAGWMPDPVAEVAFADEGPAVTDFEVADEVAVLEAAPSFELVAEPAFEEPSLEPIYEVSYEPASYDSAYGATLEEPSAFAEAPAYELATPSDVAYPSSFESYEPVAEAEPEIRQDEVFQTRGDLRYTAPEPPEPTPEEIALEAEAEPALEDTNIWADEKDDEEPTQVGRAKVVAPPAREAMPLEAQQTVRLDLSMLQQQASAQAQSRPSFGDDTADFARPVPVVGSEDPTLIGRSAIAPDLAAPAPSFSAPPVAESAFGASAGYVPPSFAPPVAAPVAGTSSVFGAEPKEGGSTEVRPPADLVGPGLAFSTTPVRTAAAAPSGAEEAMREEAKRLARLLVSEIKLYNEEIIEEGRRSGNIYERLKDDIDRSRQMYEERIDVRLADQTDYFYQELVQRLAGGDARLLGI